MTKEGISAIPERDTQAARRDSTVILAGEQVYTPVYEDAIFVTLLPVNAKVA
jgi:hypothetical protein